MEYVLNPSKSLLFEEGQLDLGLTFRVSVE